MNEKTWKNRGKYGEGRTQAEELEIALRELKEAREEEERRRAAKGLPGTGASRDGTSSK